MRLDKYLADCGLGTRSGVKTFVKKGRVTVDGVTIRSNKFQLDANEAIVCFDGKEVEHQTLFYYIMNKPAGVVSVTKDNLHKTALELLQEKDFREDLFAAGRLDKDTEGLLLITNDGLLAHEILSPSKHVEKEYYAELDGIAKDELIEKFAEGIELHGEKGNPFKGELKIDDVRTTCASKSGYKSLVRLTIHRGVYHQVKRMFRAVGLEVVYLKRLRMGNLVLPDLNPGKYRPLTKEELEALKKG